MRYSVEIRKFLYSQYFYGGLRIAVGISLPAVLCLLVFHDASLGFKISTGALGACAVDMPGPLKYKRNEMLACSAIGFLSAFATGLATVSPIALWCTIVPLAFVLSMIVVYGNRWPQISFATLFMMVVTLEEHFTPLQALVNAAWILAGGLWYTSWATFVSRLLANRIEQQALAESAFACADYLLTRAQFYDLDSNLDECYRELVDKQIAAIERQDAARDIVLRNLPKFRRGKLDAQRARHFNLFINIVDLHELFVGSHTDYPLVRSMFAHSDLLVFYRDLIRKAAADLEDMGLAVLQNQTPRARINMKAELRAIEYELELMREHRIPVTDPQAYAALAASFRRTWSATRLIERMRRRLASETPPTDTELRLDAALQRFVSRRRVPIRQIFSNLTMASPSFRHALRVTLVVASGFWLGKLLPLTNAYWIVMTSVIILKPGYSLTRQRNTQRIVGTLIGCAASIALILFVPHPEALLIVMFASMVMSYSLLLFNYTASVVFTSSYVLLMFHLLAPGSLRIIGERAIDTVIGCMIAIAASHLFPYWEYRLMGKLVNSMIAATRQYLEASCGWLSGKAPEMADVGAAVKVDAVKADAADAVNTGAANAHTTNANTVNINATNINAANINTVNVNVVNVNAANANAAGMSRTGANTVAADTTSMDATGTGATGADTANTDATGINADAAGISVGAANTGLTGTDAKDAASATAINMTSAKAADTGMTDANAADAASATGIDTANVSAASAGITAASATATSVIAINATAEKKAGATRAKTVHAGTANRNNAATAQTATDTADTSPGVNAANASAANTASAPPAATAPAFVPGDDFRYRLARKNVHIAFANLGQAFQRMMREPKSAQKFVPELNDLLIRSHVLASQITATAPLLQGLQSPREPAQPSMPAQTLQHVLACVHTNLRAAEAGTAAPGDQAAITRQLTHALDVMVVEAERVSGPSGAPGSSADMAQDLKLLAHQCKQMLAASWLIRKDASVIRLPDA